MSIDQIRHLVHVPAEMPAATTTPQPISKGEDFRSILEGELHLSQHAATRIKSRALPWDEQTEKKIAQGIDAASKKGSRDVLILADSIAVIANIPTRTIVTAMDRNQLKEKVFTNIDSTVLV